MRAGRGRERAGTVPGTDQRGALAATAACGDDSALWRAGGVSPPGTAPFFVGQASSLPSSPGRLPACPTAGQPFSGGGACCSSFGGSGSAGGGGGVFS